MNSQHNNYYQQGQYRLEGSDQGSWQQPLQNSSGQGEIYYSAGPTSYLDQSSPNRQTTGGSYNSGYNTTNTQAASSSSNATFQSGIAEYSNDTASQNQNVYMGMNSLNSKPYQNDGACGNYYNNYGYNTSPSESYNSFTDIKQTARAGATDMSGFSGYSVQGPNYTDNGFAVDSMSGSEPYNNSMEMIDYHNNGTASESDGRRGGFNNTGVRGSNYSSMRGQFSTHDNMRDSYGKSHFYQDKNISSSDWNRYQERPGGFGRGNHIPSNARWRGKANGGNIQNFSNHKRKIEHGMAVPSITLNATNLNQWGYLRKNFNKKDDELSQHLFEIHEKYCNDCQQRNEERKALKRKKVNGQSEDQKDEEETPDEELTEEEHKMRELMGFSGFSSTKGSKVKGNSYEMMSSSKQSKDEADQDTSLTEEERKMISAIGGYSVFSNKSENVEFGAPAVTMEARATKGVSDSDALTLKSKTDGTSTADS